MPYLIKLITFMNLRNYKNLNYLFLLSIFFNFIFIFMIIILIYLCNKLENSLQIATKNFKSFELILDQKFALLNNDILLLKGQNAILTDKFNLAHALSEKTSSLSLVAPNASGDSTLFIANVILAVLIFIIASFFIYSLSTHAYTWFFKGIIGELIFLTNKLSLKLSGLLGFIDTKSLFFKDGLGNDFIIKLSTDNKAIDILIKAEGTTNYLPFTEYLVHLNGNIESISLCIKSLVIATSYLIYDTTHNTVKREGLDFILYKLIDASKLKDILVATTPDLDAEFALQATGFLQLTF